MKRVLAPLLFGVMASVQAHDSTGNAAAASPALTPNLGWGAGGNHPFYVGAELQNTRLTVSDSSSFGGLNAASYDSRFWDLRAGYRLLKFVGVEAHYGFAEQGDQNPGHYRLRGYYGIFAVPTANLSGLVELGLPIGFSNAGVTLHGVNGSGAQELVQRHLNSLAYGANLEIPLRNFWRSLPDVRLTGGGMVDYQRSDAREYGYRLGLRYDFGFGASAAGI